MNPITFPGLGLSFSINRVAFSIGSKPIYWYGIIIAVGFLLGAWYGSRISRRWGLSPDNVYDMLCWALPLSILGARAYYVIFYLDLFRNDDGSLDWGEVIAIWDGGLAIYGGIIVAVLTVLIFSKLHHIKIGAFLDIGSYGLLIGQAIGRWGNFCNQEAYGCETTLPWRMGLMKGGEYIYVHPTFLYESLWNVLGFLLLRRFAKKHRKYDGEIFTMYVAWYGFGRFWIEGLRTDSLYFFGLKLFGIPIRTSQMLALISFVIAAILLVWNLKFRRHTPEELYVNRPGFAAAEEGKPEEKVSEEAAETAAEAGHSESIAADTAEAPEIENTDNEEGSDNDGNNS